ncbi:MAG: DUF4398 domain-containing protein [Nevskia sp.]|nr:DUF4398 domain-containing protein [Nevskia sp.]
MGSVRALGAGGALALAACASVPQPPTAALQAADTAIATAESDHAADYAPLEMRTAREKLAAARADAEQPDDQRVMQSRQLADEARVDAELASAKAHLAKADAVNQELQKNNNTLRQETQRSPGG